MATNLSLSNGTQFNTTNMKPEPDEQIDALWGQNMADNQTASFYYQKAFDLGPSFIRSDNDVGQGGTLYGKAWVPYRAGYSNINGTVSYSGTRLDGGDTVILTFQIDGTKVAGAPILMDSGDTASTAVGFSWSSSGATALSHGDMVLAESILAFNIPADANYIAANIEGFSGWWQ